MTLMLVKDLIHLLEQVECKIRIKELHNSRKKLMTTPLKSKKWLERPMKIQMIEREDCTIAKSKKKLTNKTESRQQNKSWMIGNPKRTWRSKVEE